jgi:hypothetical protein
VSAERRKVLEENFQPALVAPVVVALAHESCPFNGEVFGAAGGHVSRFYMAQTKGIQVGREFTPELFYERLPDIWGEDEYIAIGLVGGEQRAQGTPVAEIPVQARRA